MNGILMISDNCRAIRENRKHQTRRLDGLKEINKEPDNWLLPPVYDSAYRAWAFYNPDSKAVWVKSRYRKGEIVYIKEAHYRYGRWIQSGVTKTRKPSWDFIPANDDIIFVHDTSRKPVLMPKDKTRTGWYLRSPLFLPADLARDFVKIKSGLPQRLQEITEEEAKDEGAECVIWYGEYAMVYENQMPVATYKAGFANLWDSINGKTYPYDSNPWEWTYLFDHVNREGVEL